MSILKSLNLISDPRIVIGFISITFLLTAYWIWPFVFAFLVSIFVCCKVQNNFLKYTSILSLVILAIVLNYFYWLILFNLNLPNIGLERYERLWFLAEFVHFSMFLMFFVTVIRTIILPKPAYSALYTGLYLGNHAFYNLCPISTLQNELAIQTGRDPINNTFFIGFFGNYNDLARIVIGIICVLLVYLAMQIFVTNKIKPEDWLIYWKERRLNIGELEADPRSARLSEIEAEKF